MIGDLVVVLDDWVSPGDRVLVMPMDGEMVISARVVVDTFRAVELLARLSRRLEEACQATADTVNRLLLSEGGPPGSSPGDIGEDEARQASPDHPCPEDAAPVAGPVCYRAPIGLMVHGPGCTCV